MRTILARYLTPVTARVIAVTLLLMALGGVIATFALPPRPSRPLPALGSDFAGFYAAGAIARQYGFDRLYDPALQDAIVHRLQPSLRASEGLPFAHPPFVAVAFALLAAIPYAYAVVVWLLLSAGLYFLSIRALLNRNPGIPPTERNTALLLAMSFPPFLFECWVGGQLSALGVAAVTLAILWRRSARPVLAGLALAILCYKPTLLVLLGPLLLLERAWKTLLGFLLGVLSLAAFSTLGTGLAAQRAFVERLQAYAGTGGSSGAMFRTFKYIDLPAFLRLLHVPAGVSGAVALALAAVILVLIARSGWASSPQGTRRSELAWGVALCLTPVLNVYGPVYDASLVVPGVILAGDAIGRTRAANWPAYVKVVVALYACSLVAPLTASWLDVQLLTPALAITAVCLARLGLRPTPDALPTSAHTGSV